MCLPSQFCIIKHPQIVEIATGTICSWTGKKTGNLKITFEWCHMVIVKKLKGNVTLSNIKNPMSPSRI